MSRKLDISTAIRILGEDRLFEELSRNRYVYIHYGRKHIQPFKTDGNPIEWLVFNSKHFFVTLYDIWNDVFIQTEVLEDVDRVISETGDMYGIVPSNSNRQNTSLSWVAMRYINGFKDSDIDTPNEWSVAMWKGLKDLKGSKMSSLLEESYSQILNGEHKSIFDKELLSDYASKMQEVDD
jgi:hypothetical protein